MIWLFLLGALAFVLGGVLSVRPTKAQKRVAEIRERAIQMGMHVKLPVSLKFPDGIEKGRLPFYCKHVASKGFNNSFYCAQRDGDRVKSSQGDISTTLKTGIDKILISANQQIDGFYLGNSLVGFSWQESDSTAVFDELCQCIEQVQSLLTDAG